MAILIIVDDVNIAIELILNNGGKITEEVGKHMPEITAPFCDPYRNLRGLYKYLKDKNSFKQSIYPRILPEEIFP